MMNETDIATATLDQLNDELAAGGMPSTETSIFNARKSVRALVAEFAPAKCSCDPFQPKNSAGFRKNGLIVCAKCHGVFGI